MESVSGVSDDAAPAPPVDATTDGPWKHAVAARATRERGRRTLVKRLDAAVAEFSAYGYHGARVARVAKRAGTSHGTFYVYFTGKDDLLLAVYEESNAESLAILFDMPALEPGPDGFDALHGWVKRVCVNYQHDGAIRGAINDALAYDADPRIITQALRGVGRWTGFFADRIRATGSTGLDPNLAAVAIYNLLDAANRGVFTGQLVVSLDELAVGLTEFIHRSIFGLDPRHCEPEGTTPLHS
jgi:AcrR family transcriptional regulator